MNKNEEASRMDTDKPEDHKKVTEQRLKEEGTQLSTKEMKEVESRLRLRSAVVYETIRQEGEEELARRPSSLWWSGIAAGMAIGFSVIAEGLLRAYLPDTSWRPLVDNFGYSVGFLVVIMARQQLFTENTLTAVLPLLATPSKDIWIRTARLWGIVFAANMIGTLIVAAGLSSDLFFSEEPQAAMREISRHLMALDPGQMFLRGIVAGWIIATLVWLLPSAESASFFVIVLLTYLIALGDLAHVIAGSVEAFLLAFDGEVSWTNAIFGFLLPALAGNIVGGSAIFALITYAQVRDEI